MNRNQNSNGQIELDQDQLIFRQIDRYQRLFGKIKEERFKKNSAGSSKIVTESNEDAIAFQAWIAAKNLKSMVSSLMSEEEKQELDQFVNEHGMENMDNSRDLILDSQELFEKTVHLLSKKNMIFEEPESLILNEEEGEAL